MHDFKKFEGIEETLPAEVWHRIMDYLLAEYVDGLQAALTSSVVVPFNDALSSLYLICSDDCQKLVVPYTMAIAEYDPIEKQWRTYNGSTEGCTLCTVGGSFFLTITFAQFLSKDEALFVDGDRAFIQQIGKGGKRLVEFVHGYRAYITALSASTTYLMMSDYISKVTVWNVKERKCELCVDYNEEGCVCAQFSPAEDILCVGTVWGKVLFFRRDDAGWHKEAVLNNNGDEYYGKSVDTIVFNAAGTHFVTSSSDGIARLWTVQDRRCLQEFSGHRVIPSTGGETAISGAWFVPNKKNIVTLDPDKIRLWDSSTGECLTEECVPEEYLAQASNPYSSFIWAKIHPSGDYLVVCLNYNEIHLYDMKTGRFRGQLQDHENGEGPYYPFCFDASGDTLITRRRREVRLWSMKKALASLEMRHLSVRQKLFLYAIAQVEKEGRVFELQHKEHREIYESLPRNLKKLVAPFAKLPEDTKIEKAA